MMGYICVRRECGLAKWLGLLTRQTGEVKSLDHIQHEIGRDIRMVNNATLANRETRSHLTWPCCPSLPLAPFLPACQAAYLNSHGLLPLNNSSAIFLCHPMPMAVMVWSLSSEEGGRCGHKWSLCKKNNCFLHFFIFNITLRFSNVFYYEIIWVRINMKGEHLPNINVQCSVNLV